MPRHRITDEYSLVKRKGSANWYLEWREHGEKQRRSTGTASLGDARVKAREIILGTAAIRDQRPADMPVMAVVDRYNEQHGLKSARKSANKRAAKLWREFWRDASVADLTIDRLEAFEAWLYGRGYSQGYVRSTLALGKSALNRAWQRQEITSAPFVRLPQPGAAFPHHAKIEHLAAFLNAIPDGSHLWTYCMIRLNTACRGDAALDLQPFQVDFDDNLVELNPRGRRQTKKFRPTVRLTRTLRAVLLAESPAAHYVNWHGRKIASIKKTWNAIRDSARLPDWFAPKILRHTMATMLRRRGVPGWEVSGLLGHGAGDGHRTTNDYAKYDPAYQSAAATAIDEIMLELAAKVPRLGRLLANARGASAGSVAAEKETARTRESRAVPNLSVVEPAGIEPATSTMPLSSKINSVKHLRARIISAGVTEDQHLSDDAGSVRGQRPKAGGA